MNHRAAPGFWKALENLPGPVQTLARRNFDLLKADPSHPSLHFKTVGRFRSVRVGLHHRALGVARDDGVVWFWIGSHADYDRLIR